ncbi:MAG: hypothetical protein PHE89_02270 [Alphaproteobacteria bacterium]|nr:hypothetical protein [Alphaproteobacteria bacterium]
MTNLLKICLGMVASVFIISCSVSPQTEATAEREVQVTSNLMEKAKAPSKVAPEDVIRVKNDIWLGDKSTVEYEGEPLPTYLEAKDGITLVSNRPITLYEIGDMINKVTSIQVRYAPALEKDAISAALENAPTTDNMNLGWAEPTKMLVSYKGPLSGLLDEVSSRFGIWWKYENNQVYFYRYVTKTFVLYSLPTKQSLTANVGGQSTGAGGGGTSSISLTSSAEIELWTNVEKSITSMVDTEAKLSIDSTNGTITLTANPNDIKKVAKFVNEQNQRLAKQVAISVKVFQVTLKDADKYGLNLNAGFDDGKTKFTLLSPANAFGDDMAKNISMAIKPSNWSLDASIQALSTQGTANLVTSGTVTTLNNKPAPIQVVSKQKYISEITKTNSGGDANFVDLSVETDEIETGFTMDVLPRILEHNRLMVSFNLTLSDLVSLERVNIGEEDSGQFIQNPVIESRGFTQEVAMKSGETLILTGYEKVDNNIEKTGVGKASNTLFGGSTIVEKDKAILVIVMTPVVLESPLTPESRMRDM